MSDKKALMQQRLIGLLLIVVGAGFGYFCVYGPLHAAQNHVASFTFSKKMAGVTPLILLGGVILFLFPGFSLKHMGGQQDKGPKTALGWALIGVLVAISFVFSLWLEAQLRSYGYNV